MSDFKEEESAFDIETMPLSPRERVSGTLIQQQLIDIFNELKDFDIKNDQKLEIYKERLKQFLVDNVSNLNEINYDILDIFKQFPDYNKFFKTIEDKESKKSEEEILDQEKKLWLMTKTQLRKIIEKDLMKYTLKLMIFYGMITDISINSIEKLYEYITKPKHEIPPLIPKVVIKKVEEEEVEEEEEEQKDSDMYEPAEEIPKKRKR